MGKPEVCLLQFQVDAYDTFRSTGTSRTSPSPRYHRPRVPIRAKAPPRFFWRPLFKKPRGEPSQVFDLDLGAIDEIFGSVLDKNDPAKSGNREKC
jgi:hypothetical protein